MRIQQRKQIFLATILLLSGISMVGLHYSTPATAIQTYEPGVETGSLWAGEYVDGPLISDQKLGAPMATQGNYNARYPRKSEYQMTRAIFYGNYSAFAREANSRPVLLSESMTRYGFRAGNNYHKPMSERGYSARTSLSDEVYSNGKLSLLYPNSETGRRS